MSESTNATTPDAEGALDRLDELVSMLLDDAIEPEALAEIEQLLTDDETARQRYVEMTQLHGELVAFYREAKTGEPSPSGIVANALDLPTVVGNATLPASDSSIG